MENDPPLPPSLPAESRVQRDEWMLPPGADLDDLPQTSRPEEGPAAIGQVQRRGEDFFSSLGTERKRPEVKERPNPDQVCQICYNFYSF